MASARGAVRTRTAVSGAVPGEASGPRRPCRLGLGARSLLSSPPAYFNQLLGVEKPPRKTRHSRLRLWAPVPDLPASRTRRSPAPLEPLHPNPGRLPAGLMYRAPTQNQPTYSYWSERKIFAGALCTTGGRRGRESRVPIFFLLRGRKGAKSSRALNPPGLQLII